MHQKFTHVLLSSCLLVTVLMYQNLNAQNCTPPAVGCTNTDFTNSFLNSSAPTTIEYDNMVSTLHSTMARNADGKVWVWGERMNANGTSHGLLPKELNATNFPALTGQILKFTGGSQETNECQFTVLTTTGLFIWGRPGDLVSTTVKSTAAFAKVTIDGKSDGLPPGVSPADVKMLFGSFKTMAITTCDGNVWMLSDAGSKYGNGLSESSANASKWHRVRTNQSGNPFLTNIIAARGVKDAMVALRSDGTLWTWGAITYLGNNTAAASRNYATQMTMPTGAIIPKMIGMSIWGNATNSRTNYYLLSTTGALYALGDNNDRQLGDFTTTERTNWVRVKKSSATDDFLTDVVWISPQEHERWYSASINVLTSNGDIWAWGYNGWFSLGFNTNGAKNPTLKPGGLSALDKISAVETGGHTTIIVKQCSGKYGYVGHRINGSMGDGIAAEDEEPVYNFSETAVLDLCSAPAVANIISDENSIICPSISFTVAANSNGNFSVTSGNATINAFTGVLNITGEGPVGISYSSGIAACPTIDNIVLQQRDFGNLNPTNYPIASATTLATGKAWLGITSATADCGTDINDGADGLQIFSGSLPVSGVGSIANPFIVKGSETYNFRVTVNGSGTAKPVYWAVWYDVNGNGTFTDTEDVFQTGNILHGSPVTTNFNVNIPITGSAAGATTGAIRVAATAVNTTFTKGMNGTVTLTNGEIEDFYISYYFPLPVSLLSFDAVKQEKTTLVQWVTASEQNNKGFDILRSNDANNWTSLSFINSKTLNGNTNQQTDYSFIDHSPGDGINYYRLKQVDFDGKYEYSYIKQVTFNTNKTISIYPNPATEKITINGLSGTETIRILDMTGRVIKTIKATSSNNVVQLSNLAKGMYHVNIITADGDVIAKKIVKMK